MFDTLTDKLNGIFERLTRKGRLTEKDVEEALRQVRLALLEADVNFRVARALVNRVQERVVGSDVMEALSPGQQVVKIVHEELTSILTGGDHKLVQGSRPPTVLMLVGLQGAGKTTTAAKLAHHLQQQGQQPLLIAGDLRRPAAEDLSKCIPPTIVGNANVQGLVCGIKDVAPVPGRTHERLLQAHDSIAWRGKPTIRGEAASPNVRILLCVTRSARLRVNLCGVASVRPPMPFVTVLKHVFRV